MPQTLTVSGVRANVLFRARQIIKAEADALLASVERLGDSFLDAIEHLLGSSGRVVVTGIGKSADVAVKIVGTLNSTGTRAYFLDPTRAVHGDLGMVDREDTALVLSHSGESEELVRLLGPLKRLCNRMVAITGNQAGTLARLADHAVVYGPIVEADPLALAPSSSTTVMMAIGDALAFCLSEQRQFTPEDFARFHPAGSLGRKLASVEAYMRRGADLRVAQAALTVREVFASARHHGRRTGAIILVDANGVLTGLFTDSDLARLFESRHDDALDRPIADVMTRHPITVSPKARLAEVIDLMRDKKISEVPVVDEGHYPVGLLDITDLIGIPPVAESSREKEGSLRVWAAKSA